MDVTLTASRAALRRLGARSVKATLRVMVIAQGQAPQSERRTLRIRR